MTNKLFFVFVLISALLISALGIPALAAAQVPETSATAPDMVISARARRIHDSGIVIDTHADTPQRFLDEGFDIGSTDSSTVEHRTVGSLPSTAPTP